MVTLYHYLSSEKLREVQETGFLEPTGPFNSNVPLNLWGEYASKFSFPVFEKNTFCFLEPKPPSWQEYGLFELLMKEFSTGDDTLEITVLNLSSTPLLIRDHSFHSPKAYGYLPEEWKKREIRNSRPDLREKWYNSTIRLSHYNGNYLCPEVLIPFPITIKQIKVICPRNI